jgi:hypothetical protein
MTDDEILAAADRIRATSQRCALRRLHAEGRGDGSWEVPHKAGLNESSASVMVPREAVQALVLERMGELSEG